MKFEGTVKLETERLILRRVTINDAEDMFKNWASDVSVTKHLTWEVHKSVDITKEIIGMWQEDYKRNDNFQWGIELKSKGELIGCISVVGINENIEEVVIGYCLGKSFWNKGIMTEALKAVEKYFFIEAGANRIEAYHKIENKASGRVMIKGGMKSEGIRRAGSKDKTGEYVDVQVYSILKDEYFAKINEVT